MGLPFYAWCACVYLLVGVGYGATGYQFTRVGAAVQPTKWRNDLANGYVVDQVLDCVQLVIRFAVGSFGKRIAQGWPHQR